MAEAIEFSPGKLTELVPFNPQRDATIRTMTMTERRDTEDELILNWRQSEDEWERAHAAWLADHATSEHTQRAYEYATLAFFDRVGVKPWLVNGAHVRAWQQEMRDEGLAEASINQRLAALSSFYEYCERIHVFTLPLTLREVSLAESNPVRRVTRAKVDAYAESVALTTEQTRALLRACNRLTVVGARDYALLLAYVMTGARNAEIRTLKWGDIQEKNGKIFFDWQGKRGKRATEEMPKPVYDAIVVYLQAAGRWDGLQEDDFIFVALSDVAERLPNVDKQPNRPISSAMVNRIVKKNARRAGLRWKEIHTHSLRHSAALMYYESSGKDVRRVAEVLHHSNPATTLIYLNHLEDKGNDLWQDVAALLGV